MNDPKHAEFVKCLMDTIGKPLPCYPYDGHLWMIDNKPHVFYDSEWKEIEGFELEGKA